MRSWCAWLAKFLTRDVESIICQGRKVSRGIDNEGCSRFLKENNSCCENSNPETFFEEINCFLKMGHSSLLFPQKLTVCLWRLSLCLTQHCGAKGNTCGRKWELDYA